MPLLHGIQRRYARRPRSAIRTSRRKPASLSLARLSAGVHAVEGLREPRVHLGQGGRRLHMHRRNGAVAERRRHDGTGAEAPPRLAASLPTSPTS